MTGKRQRSNWLLLAFAFVLLLCAAAAPVLFTLWNDYLAGRLPS